MALGYEGLIKLGDYYVLGTGSSVPRTRIRLESAAGYGGKIGTPPLNPDETEIGIGAPFNYDWSQVDGSINFDMTSDVWSNEIKSWLFDRQSFKQIILSSRNANVQQYDTCFFNNMSISTSDGAGVDGSVGFVALEQNDYTWGSLYKDNRRGNDAICTDANFPDPLNPNANKNKNPVPYWMTNVWVTVPSFAAVKKNFITWSLDFSQEVVKFFGCNDNGSGTDPLAQLPLFVAVGPMTATFSGSYMESFTGGTNGFLGDHLTQIEVDIAGTSIKLLRCEANSESDDVQTGDSMVPLTVEYAAYEIKST